MLYGSMLDPIVLYLGVIGICRQDSICVLFAICGFTNRIQKHIKTYRISICFFYMFQYDISNRDVGDTYTEQIWKSLGNLVKF